MENETEFFSVFVARDPVGNFHRLIHVRWVFQFVATLKWARKRPFGRIKFGSLVFDPPIQGGPTDGAINAVLNNPAPPSYNDIANDAVKKSAGEHLNKMDSEKRSLLLPKDFFT
jgi:hypothetical protein